MTRQRWDTAYYQATELRENAQIGDTPHCVYVELDSDQVWELLHRLVHHLQYAKPEETFSLSFPCTLQKCGLWGSPSTLEEQERP